MNEETHLVLESPARCVCGQDHTCTCMYADSHMIEWYIHQSQPEYTFADKCGEQYILDCTYG
jgi:hypothetical protein